MTDPTNYTLYTFRFAAFHPVGGAFSLNCTVDTQSFPSLTDELALEVMDALAALPWPAGVSFDRELTRNTRSETYEDADLNAVPPVFH